MDFEALKKKRGGNSMQELQRKMEDMKGGTFEKDARLWKPKLDSNTGKAYAVIRFLPPPEGEPFVHKQEYWFKGPGGSYKEMSRKMLGRSEPDPVGELNNTDWEKGAAGQARARSRKINHSYYANILILEDQQNPENNGRVCIFDFGKAVFNLIDKALTPEHQHQTAFDPFDMWEGRNLIIALKEHKMPGNSGEMITVPSYDDVTFDPMPSALFDGDDEKLKAVFEQCISLKEFANPDEVKSYDELSKKLARVMATGGTGDSTAGDMVGGDAAPAAPVGEVASAPKPAPSAPEPAPSPAADAPEAGEIDPADFFADS